MGVSRVATTCEVISRNCVLSSGGVRIEAKLLHILVMGPLRKHIWSR